MDWNQTDYGQLTIVQMTTAPYPHSSRMNGVTRGTTVYSFEEHYNNSSVAFIIPNDYKPVTNLNIIVHFHGHLQDLPRVLSFYKLGEQLNASGKNAILVIPQGPVKSIDSQFGKLDDKDGFKNFINEFMGFIKNDEKINPKHRKLNVDKIILMGHSGGYYTIGSVLDHGGLTKKIQEVYLLDATYGQLSKYTDWLSHTRGRLMSIFTDHLAFNNVEFMTLLKKAKVPYGLVMEKELNDSYLKRNRVLFLPTEIEHDNVPSESRLVERFLKTSCLPNK